MLDVIVLAAVQAERFDLSVREAVDGRQLIANVQIRSRRSTGRRANAREQAAEIKVIHGDDVHFGGVDAVGHSVDRAGDRDDGVCGK